MRQRNYQDTTETKQKAESTLCLRAEAWRGPAIATLTNGPQSAHSQDAGLKKHFEIIFFLLWKKKCHRTMQLIRTRIRYNYILQVFSLRFREKPSQILLLQHSS